MRAAEVVVLALSIVVAQRSQFVMDQQSAITDVTNNYGFSAPWLAAAGFKQVAGDGFFEAASFNGVPGGPWYNASGQAYLAAFRSQVNATINAALSAGMQPFMASDFIQVPALLAELYAANLTVPGATCIGYKRGPSCISLRSDFTLSVLASAFDELFSLYPRLAGLIFRYGENSPGPYNVGNAPYDPADPIDTLALFVSFVRQQVVERHGRIAVIRTWDTSTTLFHANASFYAAVVDQVTPSPSLVFSIKHTMLDFWRRVRVNPCLGVGKHGQIVEVEAGGLYAGEVSRIGRKGEGRAMCPRHCVNGIPPQCRRNRSGHCFR